VGGSLVPSIKIILSRSPVRCHEWTELVSHTYIFNVSDDSFQTLLSISGCNHMYVTTHDAVCIQFQTFVALAIVNAIQENISVLWPDENIQPVNNGERYEVNSLLIPDFKFTAHK
jgi:hypothetical protein